MPAHFSLRYSAISSCSLCEKTIKGTFASLSFVKSGIVALLHTTSIYPFLTRHSSRYRKYRMFDIPFDRQQLADYLCIDRAAVSTEISKLQKEGFVKTNRNHFELTVSKNVDSRMKGRAIY